MQIVIRKNLTESGATKIRGSLFFALIFMLLIGAAFLSAWLGYRYGAAEQIMQAEAAQNTFEVEQELSAQRQDIANATQEARDNLDALAQRLGEMQAHVIRLDALGGRLVEMAKLDNGEFDFSQKPAVGGPENAEDVAGFEVPDFLKSLESLANQIEDRNQQLTIMETMIMSRQLQDEVYPAGRPIESGWISSYYGMRTDPFTGRPARHEGVDFAGKKGSNVIAVAAGVVTWAGSRYGYGNLVEVNHGNGYVTRYGHNNEVKVAVGDTVKKGQVLALMGSSGRSTGPHVHFEVLHRGRVVNPLKYIKASR